VPSQPFLRTLDRRAHQKSTPTIDLDPPDSRTSKSAAKRESCRNKSNYRTQPGKGQSKACNRSASQNTERLSGSLRFFRLQFARKGNLAGKVPSRFGDWIAPQIKTTCWRRFRVCRWCAPGLRRSCTRSTVQPISPEFDFPHRKIFRRPVTGHQSRRAASSEAALPVTHFPAQTITGKS
jgi:hypothetical protein